MAHGGREIEIKLGIADAGEGRRKLRAAGFRVARRRVFEANIVYDTPSSVLREQGKLLRLRTAGKVHTLTFKGPPSLGKHKSRVELEVSVSDAATAARVIEALGYEAKFRYEKYRTEFAKPGEAGIAVIDETPIGCFLELEGPPRWIDRTARALGFRESDYNTKSYGTLYLDYCRERGIRPAHMVFRRK
jgi:adenylate cyclase, class 2